MIELEVYEQQLIELDDESLGRQCWKERIEINSYCLLLFTFNQMTNQLKIDVQWKTKVPSLPLFVWIAIQEVQEHPSWFFSNVCCWCVVVLSKRSNIWSSVWRFCLSKCKSDVYSWDSSSWSTNQIIQKRNLWISDSGERSGNKRVKHIATESTRSISEKYSKALMRILNNASISIALVVFDIQP